MSNSSKEIAAKISAHTYTHAAWMKSWEEVATMLMIRNMQAGNAGRPCPVAGKVLARVEANLLTK